MAKSKYPKSHRSANAKKGAITRLKNKLAKATKALEFLQDAAENLLCEGCDVCGNSVDVYDFGEGGQFAPVLSVDEEDENEDMAGGF